VHHPHEDIDFGSHEDVHRHYHAEDDRYHPRESAESYQHYHRDGYWANDLPINNAMDKNGGKYDNVLEDEDPAICFVKAYARKPLGAPKKTVANSMDLHDYWYGTYEGYPSNALDYWYDDYDDEDDEYGDEYDNFGLYDDYSDSEGDYYDEEGDFSDELDDSEEEEEETSSGDDKYDDQFDLTFDDHNLWDKDSHHRHSRPQAQYFDLAADNQ
jgi:hypothetical protein